MSFNELCYTVSFSCSSCLAQKNNHLIIAEGYVANSCAETSYYGQE
jgi:hypothetical protein